MKEIEMTMNIKKTLLSAIMATVLATQSYSMEELATEKPASPKEVATTLMAIKKFRPNSLLRRHDTNIVKVIGSLYVSQADRDALKAKFLTGVLRVDCYNNVIRELKISDLPNHNGKFDLEKAVAETDNDRLADDYSFHVGYPLGDQTEGEGNQTNRDQKIHIHVVDKYTALKVPHLAELRDLLHEDQAHVVFIFRMGRWRLNEFEYHISSFTLMGTKKLGDIYENGGKRLQYSEATSLPEPGRKNRGWPGAVSECFSISFIN
jgi:hypothetical protein